MVDYKKKYLKYKKKYLTTKKIFGGSSDTEESEAELTPDQLTPEQREEYNEGYTLAQNVVIHGWAAGTLRNFSLLTFLLPDFYNRYIDDPDLPENKSLYFKKGYVVRLRGEKSKVENELALKAAEQKLEGNKNYNFVYSQKYK